MNMKTIKHLMWTAAFAGVIVLVPIPGWPRDGELASGQSALVQHFDQDGDGLVSPDEFPGEEAQLSSLDTDGDGYIDETEAPRHPPKGLPGEKEMLTEFDTDGDGLISSDEFPGPADHFEILDADGDGFLSAEELLAGRPVPPAAGGFEGDDADQDGMVSQAEFSGSEEFFNRLDADGDGFITRQEALSGRPGPGPRNGGSFQPEQQ